MIDYFNNLYQQQVMYIWLIFYSLVFLPLRIRIQKAGKLLTMFSESPSWES